MKINYCLNGKGKETVLFLHGWGANLNSFSFFSEQLKNNYKTLLVDFPGFGNSEKLNYSFELFDYATEVFKLLKELNLNNITIVSHSFGTRVAILLCTHFNIKINQQVVIGGAGIKPKFNIFLTFKIYKYKLLKLLATKKIIKTNLSKFGSEDYKNLDPLQKQTFIKIINTNLKKHLKKIECSTLLIWGEQDKSTPLYMGKLMHKKIKNSKLVVLKNAGHFCFLTHAKLVLFEINNFLLT